MFYFVLPKCASKHYYDDFVCSVENKNKKTAAGQTQGSLVNENDKDTFLAVLMVKRSQV